MNIRSSGIFGDSRSGSGLFEGVPEDLISRRTWCTFFTDALVAIDSAAATGWTTTNQGATGGFFGNSTTNATLVQDGLNGIVRVFSTTADQGVSAQFDGTIGAGAFIAPVAGRTIVYETALTFGTASNADCSWFAGLMPLDTTPVSIAADATLGNPIAVGGDNFIGFHQRNNTTAGATEAQPFMAYAGGGVANMVRTTTGRTITDGTQFTIGMRLYGMSTLEYYWGTRSTGTTEPGGTQWNTVRLARVTMANAIATNTLLTPTYYIIANSGADVWFDIDYLLVAQTR